MSIRRLALPLTLLALSVACGKDRASDKRASARPTPEERAPKTKASRSSKAPKAARALDAPPVVIFAVIDTLRADHTSLCGYGRPTTPVLEAIVRDRGAAHTCRAYAPAPWTHPSHATFFTGKSVVEHAAIWVTESDVRINPVTRVRPLSRNFDTLAERFGEAGYQTAAISANMIVTKPSGLLQGFDHVEIAPEATAFRGERFTKEVKKVVKDLKPGKPLFLFLNLYDAHDPYPAIPKKVPWLPEQGLLNLHPNLHEPQYEYYRYVKGLSSEEESEDFLRRVRNGYDWGVHMADAGLGETLSWLEEEGWLANGYRLIITSDHGEFLGEHRLMRHGGFLYEPVVNVPFLFLDTTQAAQPTLPEPFSGQSVFHMALTGEVPTDLPPVHAVSEPNEHDILVGALGGAIWSGTDKVMCASGERSRYDLSADPGEEHREPVEGHPLADELEALCAKVREMYALPPPERDDEEIVEALKAVGYMQ